MQSPLFGKHFAFPLASFGHRLGGRRIQCLLPHRLLLVYEEGAAWLRLEVLAASICCLHQEMDCTVQGTAFCRTSQLIVQLHVLLRNNFWLELAIVPEDYLHFWWYFVQAIKQLHRIK